MATKSDGKKKSASKAANSTAIDALFDVLKDFAALELPDGLTAGFNITLVSSTPHVGVPPKPKKNSGGLKKETKQRKKSREDSGSRERASLPHVGPGGSTGGG